MSEVLIERPRWAHAARYPRAYARNRTADDEGGPSREKMGGFYRDKHFDDHLGPLRRFLQSRVGRPWSKVHAEMAEHLRVTSTVQRHVMEHVRQYVWMHTWFDDDGELWGMSGHGSLGRVGAWGRTPAFYVHPRTGLLQRLPSVPRKKRSESPPDPNVRTVVVDRFQHRKIGGVWFEVELAPLPPHPELRYRLGPPVWDVVARRSVRHRMSSYGDPEPMAVEWRRGFYARAMRQLSKKEIRRLVA